MAAAFFMGLECVVTRRSSPRIPPGRSRITATMRTPIINRRRLGSANMPGRNWVPDQMPQTTKAPRIAPRLLPDPPTISMAQIMNVASKRVECEGGQEPEVMGEQGPADAHDHRPQDEGLELELEHVLADGLGRRFVLADGAQHPSPRRLDRPLHQQEHRQQDNQHHYEVQVVVVFRGYQIAQEGRYPVQPLGAVGDPLLVQEEQPYGLGDSQGGNGQVIVPEPQRDVSDYEGDHPADGGGGPHAQEEPQIEAEVQKPDLGHVAAELEVLEQTPDRVAG